MKAGCRCAWPMTDHRHIAVFDVGKTSCKLVLLDGATFSEIDVRRQENAVLPAPPYPHLDTEAMWVFLYEGLAAFEAAHGVDALAITTHGSAAGLVDKAGLVLPMLDYEYEIPAEYATRYDGVRPGFEQTFSPRMPIGLNLGAQLHFLSIAHPDEYARAEHFLTFPQYWAWRLTGVARSERTSLGAHSDLWLPEAGQFSPLVGNVFPERLFAPLAEPGETFPLSGRVAFLTGLKPGIPVTCGIHDSNASLLPWLDAGEALSVVSSGTWTIVMSIGGALDQLDPARDMLANVDARGRPVPTAKFMGGREYEVLTEGTVGEIEPADIAAVIANDICPLPGRVPGVGPYPRADGGWTGRAPVSDKERIASATLYLALMSDTCLSLAGTGERVVIEGPFAKNQVYAQILAALVGCPVHLSSDATGTATGAAMLLGGGQSGDVGPAVKPAKIDGLAAFRDRWRALSSVEN